MQRDKENHGLFLTSSDDVAMQDDYAHPFQAMP
jgi:hypothetical protein